MGEKTQPPTLTWLPGEPLFHENMIGGMTTAAGLEYRNAPEYPTTNQEAPAMREIDEPVVFLPNHPGARTRAARALGLAWPPDGYDAHAYESGVVFRHHEGRYLMQLIIAFDWENEEQCLRADLERAEWIRELRELKAGRRARKNYTTFKDWCQRLKRLGLDGPDGSDSTSMSSAS
jgi:hypothetical protein